MVRLLLLLFVLRGCCLKYCNESWFVSVGVGDVSVGGVVLDGLFLYVSSEQSGLPEV